MSSNNIHRILFIINPKAGAKRNLKIDEIIDKHLPEKLDYDILNWEHSSQDIKSIIQNKINKTPYDVVVSVGGDGTVNAISQALVNTKTPLYILPMGSGNGLARQLKIPINIKKAIQGLSTIQKQKMDSCTINGNYFFCTAGVGFDAHIGKEFDNSNTRGFITYAKIFFKEFSSYQAQEYEFTIDGKTIKREALTLTFANATQYGNNAHIAPHACIRDGIINITIAKPFGLLHIPFLIYRLFTKSIHKSRFIETFTGKEIFVKRSNPGIIHVDGEPLEETSEITIKIEPNSLNIYC